MLTVIVFIFFGEYGFFQTVTITILSFSNLWIMIGNKPYSHKKTGMIELANEGIVYLCCIIKLCFTNVAIDFEVRNDLAKLMIILCLSNVT